MKYHHISVNNKTIQSLLASNIIIQNPINSFNATARFGTGSDVAFLLQHALQRIANNSFGSGGNPQTGQSALDLRSQHTFALSMPQ